MNRRVLAIILILSAVIGIGTSAAALTGVLTITPGAESLQLVDYTFQNVTIKNVGSNSATLVKVDVERTSWNGYSPTPQLFTVYLKSQLVIASGQVGTFSESFTGSGWNVTAHIVTERGHIFTWFLPYHLPQPHPVVLIINQFSLSGTHGGGGIDASASDPFTLQSYTIKDSNGNKWENNSISVRFPSGITNGVGISFDVQLGPWYFGGSVYTGVAGAFDKFTTGNQYTLVLGISTNEQFFFSVPV